MGNPNIPSYQKPWSFQDFYEDVIEGKKNDWKITPEELDQVIHNWGIK